MINKKLNLSANNFSHEGERDYTHSKRLTVCIESLYNLYYGCRTYYATDVCPLLYVQLTWQNIYLLGPLQLLQYLELFSCNQWIIVSYQSVELGHPWFGKMWGWNLYNNYWYLHQILAMNKDSVYSRQPVNHSMCVWWCCVLTYLFVNVLKTSKPIPPLSKPVKLKVQLDNGKFGYLNVYCVYSTCTLEKYSNKAVISTIWPIICRTYQGKHNGTAVLTYEQHTKQL